MSGHSIILGILIGLSLSPERLQKNNKNRNTRETDNYRSRGQTQNNNNGFEHKTSVDRRYEEEISSRKLQEAIGYGVMDFDLKFEY